MSSPEEDTTQNNGNVELTPTNLVKARRNLLSSTDLGPLDLTSLSAFNRA